LWENENDAQVHKTVDASTKTAITDELEIAFQDGKAVITSNAVVFMFILAALSFFAA
jgi:hypothetical protein